jgi:hypothetical protein
MSLIDAGGGRLWCTVYPTRVNAFLYESWLYGISEAVTSLLALPVVTYYETLASRGLVVTGISSRCSQI